MPNLAVKIYDPLTTSAASLIISAQTKNKCTDVPDNLAKLILNKWSLSIGEIVKKIGCTPDEVRWVADHEKELREKFGLKLKMSSGHPPNPKHTPEFKREMAKLSFKIGIKEACKVAHISTSTMYD